MDKKAVRERVRERYASVALATGEQADVCGADLCCAGSPANKNAITCRLYDQAEARELPAQALSASLGCGNPSALADLKAGETVLDLGSGGGIDVLLSARRVGPAGKVFGLDMTEEMLTLARENARRAGASNVEFLRGELESVPLPDGSIDVIISNCVINLSPDKDRAFKEMFRVLRGGGRLAITDIAVRGEIPPEIRASFELWTGCIAGALEQDEYRAGLERAGFEQVAIEPVRVYSALEVEGLLAQAVPDAVALAPLLGGKLMSAFVRARKPE